MTIFRAVASGVFASGETWSWRQHLQSSSPLANVLSDWGTQVSSAWTNGTHGLETLYPTGTVLNRVTVAELSPLMREGAKQETVLALPGTGAGDSLPEQVCILVSLRGSDVGAKNRGKNHLPAPDETAATGGDLGATNGTRVTTAMTALYSGMRTAGHLPVVYNTATNPHDPVLFTVKVMVDQFADRILRSQRRRTKGRKAIYT